MAIDKDKFQQAKRNVREKKEGTHYAGLLIKASELMELNTDPFAGRKLLTDGQRDDLTAMLTEAQQNAANEGKYTLIWDEFNKRATQYLEQTARDPEEAASAVVPKGLELERQSALEARLKASAKFQREQSGHKTKLGKGPEAKAFNTIWNLFTREYTLPIAVIASIWTQISKEEHTAIVVNNHLQLPKYEGKPTIFTFITENSDAFFEAVEKHSGTPVPAELREKILRAYADIPYTQRGRQEGGHDGRS